MIQLIEGKVDSLPDEKVKEILSEALKDFLKTPTGKNLFYENGIMIHHHTQPDS